MSVYSGPGLVNSGLVYCCDSANSRIFRGEPTTNLAHTAGAANWTVGQLAGSTISRTTIQANYKYRITRSDSLSLGQALRFYVPVSVLTNGETYNLSFKYNIVSGGPSFLMNDWCDVIITANRTEVDYGSYKFQSAFGSRATYVEPFNFMDFTISPNTVVDIWEVQLEQRNYATPFTATSRGTTVATGGGIIDVISGVNNSELIGVRYNSANQGSLLFDGVDDQIYTPTNCGLTGSITLGAWIKATGNDTTHTTIIATEISYQYGVKLMNFKNNARWGLWLGFGTSNYEAFYSQNINDSNVHYVVGSWDQSTGIVKLYLDGTLVSTINTGQTSNISLLSGNIYLGRDYHPDSYFVGNIYHAQIYNRALTDAEVAQNYHAMRARFGL